MDDVTLKKIHKQVCENVCDSLYDNMIIVMDHYVLSKTDLNTYYYVNDSFNPIIRDKIIGVTNF